MSFSVSWEQSPKIGVKLVNLNLVTFGLYYFLKDLIVTLGNCDHVAKVAVLVGITDLHFLV
jgi:hypothetical protein